MVRTILPGHPAGIGYEIDRAGNLLPYELTDKEFLGSIPERSGRKSRTELYAIKKRHQRAVAEIQEREQRTGLVTPPPELRALPHIGTYYLYRLTSSAIHQYLSSTTYQLHRKLIRDLTAIDIDLPFVNE